MRSMLVYLDLLCLALLSRDSREIARLLRHPLSRGLPQRVREEAVMILRSGSGGKTLPVQTILFQNETAHVLFLAQRRHASQMELQRKAG